MWDILGQALGILAMLLTVFSYQMNTKRSLLAMQSTATLCTCLGYLCLGATSGFALNIVCLLRNFGFYFFKEKSKASYVCTAISALAMCGLGILSWQGPISLFIIGALVINTVFMSFGNPQLLRKSILVTSPMVIVYNVAVFTIGGICSEVLAVASSILGILRFRKEKKVIR